MTGKQVEMNTRTPSLTVMQRNEEKRNTDTTASYKSTTCSMERRTFNALLPAPTSMI